MESDLISQFLNITATENTATASHFLESSSWDLQQALLLFFTNNDTPLQLPSPPSNQDQVRAPLPVVRQTLYDHHDEEEEDYFPTQRNQVWESSNLEALFRPPHELIFIGTFEDAKLEARRADRWLLLNLQSMSVFDSHRLNRDVWANEAVSKTIQGNFVFWQEYNDTVEGLKVMTYYKVESVPAILVIDPVTGQMMRSWSGVVEPEGLLEGLLVFMDNTPNDNLNSFLGNKTSCRVSEQQVKTDVEMPTPSWGDEEWPDEQDSGPEYPPLPEEPTGDRALLCRVAVRFPDGQRMQRSFFKTDPIQLLWSFCYSNLQESHKCMPFCLINAIPRGSTTLDYETEVTFEQSGIANSMITLVWKNNS